MLQTLFVKDFAIVGEAEIADIVEDDLLTVWHQTKEHSGITYNFFRKYYY